MGIKIRKHRLAAGLTQVELSKLLGYESSSIITMWENGERKPPSDKLPELARLLKCKIEDLFDNKKGNE